MLYLEDYLEMIEHLPQELRDRFTEMRELDLSVQNRMDSLDKQQRTYYSKCKQGELPDEEIESESEVLLSEYYKVLEDADEKVSIATQIHELVDRYLRRLDTELFKFKCELEADNNGITEILEKRSLEMDSGSAATALLHVINNQKENRYYGTAASSNSHGLHAASGALAGSVSVPTTPSASSSNKEARYRTPKPEKRRDSLSTLPVLPEKRPSVGNTMAAGASPVPVVRPVTPSINSHAAVLNTAVAGVTTSPNASAVAYNLQQLGAGAASNAIAAAASQAIVATQQMQQGRRTASLKASYEAIHGAGGGPTEFWISRDIANAASAAAHTSLGSEKKQKKKQQANTSLTQAATLAVATPGNTPALSLASSSSSVSLDSTDLLSTTGGLVNTVGGVAVAASSFSLASLASGGASTSTAAAANRANSASSSTSSSSLTPSSNLTLGENGLVVEQTNEGEWSYDPNEPRYCTCQQVSYGDMVACDNDACPYEWFHYPCVGITQTPKGKWYCPKCTVSMRRRGNRKN